MAKSKKKKLSTKKLRKLAIHLLEGSFREVVAHLELRLIRDTQSPRFKKLKKTHPQIWKDFMAARTGPHEVLKKDREERIAILMSLAEGNFEEIGISK